MPNRRKKTVHDYAGNFEEIRVADRHVTFMNVIKSVSTVLVFGFLSILFLFIYLSVKNNHAMTLEALASIFGSFANIVGAIVGAK